MLGGGGARGAYQAGVLLGLARRCPEITFPIMTGISAGAVNTIHLAAHAGPFPAAAEDIVRLWSHLDAEQVYDVRAGPLLMNALHWIARLGSGGIGTHREQARGLVNTGPLRNFLRGSLRSIRDGTIPGIADNVAAGRLRAVALTASSYTTGQSMTWVQGQELSLWQRPQRRSHATPLTVEHVMASSALPLVFPAIEVDHEWYGDGGIRLTSPLSPALHLGATRILTISTRYEPSHAEAASPKTAGYPPPAQVLGSLYNAIFLDLIDEDIVRMRTVNRLLEEVPEAQRDGMRVVEVKVIRPSVDLGLLASEFESRLPSFVRYLTRGLGTKETVSPDFVSLILFQPDYLRRLVEIGIADGEANAEAVRRLLQ